MNKPRIPVKNIYYLLLYAWNRLDSGDIVRVAAEDSVELADLLARVLIAATQRLLREGLDRTYVEQLDESTVLRGRIDLSASVAKNLFASGRAAVWSDDLTPDNLHNRILKATLLRLARSEAVANTNRHELLALYRTLAMVSDIRLQRADFRMAQVHSNNAFYAFLLDVCLLAFDNLLPVDDRGEYRFNDFLRDERQMWRVFQDFVCNFVRMHRPDCTVGAERIDWDFDTKPSTPSFLPSMVTDITVRSRNATVVIDTKYYANALSDYRGRETFRSNNLYQLYAYLRNLECRGGCDAHAAGVLLYPEVGRKLRERMSLSKHPILVATLDLSEDWRAIHDTLLGLIAEGLFLAQDSSMPSPLAA